MNPLFSILETLKLPVEDPHFPTRAFTAVARQRKGALKEKGILERIISEEYDDLSRRVDRSKIQDSVSVRNVLRTRTLATYLINDKGEILTELLSEAISWMEQNLHSLAPERQYDSRRQLHILSVLKLLRDNKELFRLLKNISKPYSHRRAEQIIRDTLQLDAHVLLTDAHARRATFAAWMCYLRQNIGSCFATAPALIVHDEQPGLFLKDIQDLLSTGRLKRTFGGVEHAVPLSISWGAGDLKKTFLFVEENSFEKSEIWLSPGFLAAFEAVGIINREEHLKQKIEQVKSLIQRVIQGKPKSTGEEIILGVLMTHLNLKEKDLEEQQNLPTFQSPFFLQPATSGKEHLRSHLKSLQVTSENAFKAMADNALLKSWEFTLASFAETKADFATWNLYASLGLQPDEEGGIGHSIYAILKDKLDIYNRKVEDLQVEYEQMFTQVKYLETRLQRASTEKEIQWLKIEYQTQLHEFQMLEEMRDRAHHKAQRISGLFEALIDAFLELFPRYFQEVYDADMHEVAIGPYDDSPAGFRLLYKYGRANTSQWTYIHTGQEFIEALHNFFIATETEIESRQEFTGFEQDLSEIITAITIQIRNPEFLETAFNRMAHFHKTPLIKNPLQNLDKIEKKPWAYTSGGTMGTLVSCYFGLESKPTEVTQWVENAMELLVFFIDTLKQIPPKFTDDFQKMGRKSLLMHSPTHAFLLKPNNPKFFEAWQNESYTYTWVRDQMIIPMLRRVDEMVLDTEKIQFIVENLSLRVQENYRHYFKKVFANLQGDLTSVEFRQHLVSQMEETKGLQFHGSLVLPPEEIDSYLYRALPLIRRGELREVVGEILKKVVPKDFNKMIDLWDALPEVGTESFVTSKQLQNLCKSLISLATLQTSTQQDYHQAILNVTRQEGYSLAAPILVADSNWIRDDFGFVVSPGTGRVEFWRLDPLGSEGVPLFAWEQWINGSRKDRFWGMYTRPYEYLR